MFKRGFNHSFATCLTHLSTLVWENKKSIGHESRSHPVGKFSDAVSTAKWCVYALRDAFSVKRLAYLHEIYSIYGWTHNRIVWKKKKNSKICSQTSSSTDRPSRKIFSDILARNAEFVDFFRQKLVISC